MRRLARLLPAATPLAACASVAPPGEVTSSTTQAASSTCTATSTNLSNVAIKPVMHAVKAHLIYWLPNGAHFTSDATDQADARYEAALERYFADVQSMPIFGILAQYGDTQGPPQSLTYAGSYTFRVGYPAGRDGSITNPLIDADIQTVVSEVLDMSPAQGPGPGWTASADDVFFVFTALGAQSCQAAACSFPTNAADGSPRDVYGGYHGFFGHDGRNVIYSLMTRVVDDKWLAYPNDKSVDPTIFLASHELFEAITDPFGNAWQGTNGGCDEIGDKCEGVGAGTHVNLDGSNVVLSNGHRYAIQEEWSNQATPGNTSAGCTLNIAPPPAPGCRFPTSTCGIETIAPGYGTPVGYHNVEVMAASCATTPSVYQERHPDGSWTTLPRYTEYVGATTALGPPNEFDVGSQSDTGQTTSGDAVGSWHEFRGCMVSAGGTTCDPGGFVVDVVSCCTPRGCDGVCGAQTDGCGHALDCGPCGACDAECQCDAKGGIWNGSRCVFCTTQKCRCEAGGGTWSGNHCI
jgi:hypothetical protein